MDIYNEIYRDVENLKKKIEKNKENLPIVRESLVPLVKSLEDYLTDTY